MASFAALALVFGLGACTIEVPGGDDDDDDDSPLVDDSGKSDGTGTGTDVGTDTGTDTGPGTGTGSGTGAGTDTTPPPPAPQCETTQLNGTCGDLSTGSYDCDICNMMRCCPEDDACKDDAECAGLQECIFDSNCLAEDDFEGCVQNSCGGCLTQAAVDLYNEWVGCLSYECPINC
ncbi:MAG: hypothetical protein JRI23_35695 [Deltaproteobacteria bacterium]|jgi:hypothetical protein|nr:hypothetical protein [Deltaproteobacteria bacterium]MBW2537675.1 hypothetical protein [Deltaproteobacteria bacterium]